MGIPGREEFQKIAKERVTADKKPEKIFRRHFLRLGGLGVVGALGVLANVAIERNSKKKLAERGKEINSKINESKTPTPEEVIKKSSASLENFENDIKEFQENSIEVGELLGEIEVATSDPPQNLDEVSAHERILENVIKARKSQEHDFAQYQNKLVELIRIIDILLADKNKDTQGLMKKWEDGEYLERKTRIEEQMKSLNKQYQIIDIKFNILIIKIETQIQKAREKLGNKTRRTDLA